MPGTGMYYTIYQLKKNRVCLNNVWLQDDRLEKKEEARRAHEGWTRVKDTRRFRLPDEPAFRPGGTWKPPRCAKLAKQFLILGKDFLLLQCQA